MTVTQLQRRIRYFIRKWVPVLSLADWTLHVTFREADEAGSCLARSHRREATLNFNCAEILERWTLPDEVELVVVHELVHATAWSATEGAVWRLAKALLVVEAQVPGLRVPLRRKR